VAARRVRLVVLEAPVCPAISEFALFRAVAPVPVARPTANAPDVLSTAGWRIVEASAPGADTLLDDDASTIWITPAPTPGHPVQATIDLGALRQVAGFSLTP
ncbi:MAG: discoidin domain-containing protein, partial [Xanthomonas perforans]|nr:discoidin domain-containing protein [Xanthomonas perforans]